MTARLSIGAGLARARKNRSRGPRRRIDWDSVSGAMLAASPALARRFARENKQSKISGGAL